MDMANYMLFSSINQTKNSMFWTIVYMIIMFFFTEIKKNPGLFKSEIFSKKWMSRVYNLFRPRYSYVVEGKCWNTFNMVFQKQKIANSMSNTYIALIQYLTTFEGKNAFQCIYNLNISTPNARYDDCGNELSAAESMSSILQEQIVPEQLIPICVNRDLDIYCTIYFEQSREEANQNTKKEASTILYSIRIELFSYTSTAFVIKRFVDDITNKYVTDVLNKRRNQRFIYTMLSIRGGGDEDEDSIVHKNDIVCNSIVWKETPFETVKSFNTLYLKNKSAILDKINFFMNCEDWYYKHGVPYTLGIGLHGPPGTGKTSFIKSLAKHTNRHIVCISMKVVLSRNQLQSVFYETRYNKQNSYIGFKDKIIVFEDIDCTGKIVMERENNEVESVDNFESVGGGDNASAAATAEKNDSTKLLAKSLGKLLFNNTDDKIQSDKVLSLDDLLNMWDGIRETPGRIIVITSNFYHKLDKALIRPGRIDLEIETTPEDSANFSAITMGEAI